MDDLDWYLQRISDEVRLFEQEQQLAGRLAAEELLRKAEERARRQEEMQRRAHRLVDRIFRV
ncbi:hypothetical protein AAGS40_29850 (plasmid) [Paraburkholderia sp. PREW-6R]|uniref:hypothetical protein n=1 Tax=Paraburkholderia sp. PREW-6R TaxID=3141544 RepID=UPI0031F48410